MGILRFLKHHLWVKWKIPKGDYCYKITKIEHPKDKSKPPVIHIKVCAYWDEVDDMEGGSNGFCTHLHLEDPLIWDQCKSCGINDYDDEEF